MDLANFRGYEQSAPVVARIAAEPGKVEDDVFAALQAIVDRTNPKPPFNLGYSLAQNPARLAPFASGMAQRFVELNELDAKNVPNRREQASALATAISALPPAAFAPVAARMFDVIRVDHAWDFFPVLYVRAADAGVTTLDFYQREFMTEKLLPVLQALPVLAICRIGRADAETTAEMKRRFAAASTPIDNHEIREALFVTLLKLGEEAFVRAPSPYSSAVARMGRRCV